MRRYNKSVFIIIIQLFCEIKADLLSKKQIYDRIKKSRLAILVAIKYLNGKVCPI